MDQQRHISRPNGPGGLMAKLAAMHRLTAETPHRPEDRPVPNQRAKTLEPELYDPERWDGMS